MALGALTATALIGFSTQVMAEPSGVMRVDRVERDNYTSWVEVDRGLEIELWTDNESGVYYEGDDIGVYFRASRDCFVALYNVDTRGRVRLIYPFDREDDPFVEGGRIYRIPDDGADYDLVVSGPSGTESMHLVASRRPFPIPDWYDGSDLVCDGDRDDFVNYVNGRYFGCRSGCPRAFADLSFTVRDWDRYYYRPVYRDPWPVWGVCGSVYIDYHWGSSVYIDGIYMGCAPLYIPRVWLGWRTVTIYDNNGYCWEDRLQIVRDRPLRLTNTIIRTRHNVVSKYPDVRRSGFRDPVRNGYPQVRVTEKFKPQGLRDNGAVMRERVKRGAPVGRIDSPSPERFGSRKTTRATEVDRDGGHGGNDGVVTKETTTTRRLAPYKAGRNDEVNDRPSSGAGVGGTRKRTTTVTRKTQVDVNSDNRTVSRSVRQKAERVTVAEGKKASPDGDKSSSGDAQAGSGGSKGAPEKSAGEVKQKPTQSRGTQGSQPGASSGSGKGKSGRKPR